MKIGYKLWRVVSKGEILLNSLGSSNVWQPGVNLAECLDEDLYSSPNHPKGERVPIEECGCGIYALKDIRDLYMYYHQDISLPPCKVMAERHNCAVYCPLCDLKHQPQPSRILTYFEEHIFGAVMLFGRIIEGKKGFRAEKAQIQVLFSNYVAPCLLNEIAKTYRVPVVENKGLPTFKDLLDIVWDYEPCSLYKGRDLLQINNSCQEPALVASQ